jgi:hypothetical protein
MFLSSVVQTVFQRKAKKTRSPSAVSRQRAASDVSYTMKQIKTSRQENSF